MTIWQFDMYTWWLPELSLETECCLSVEPALLMTEFFTFEFITVVWLWNYH